MAFPLYAAARRSRRRLVVLTAVACLGLGVLLSGLGVFVVWAGCNLVWPEAPVGAIVVGGLAVGLALAAMLVWAGVAGATARVRDHLAPLIVDAGDHRWQRARRSAEALALAVGVPAPRVWLIGLGAPNALAVGVNPEATDLYVTTELMDLLERDELEAVLASVIASIGRFDVALGTVGYAVGDGLVDLAGMFGGWDPRSWLITIALSPFGLAGFLTRKLVLRWRGQGSDAAGMAFTRYPPALYTALLKLREDTRDVGVVPISTRHLWFEYPLFEATARSPRARRGPVSLDRRLIQVEKELRATDSSWRPPTHHRDPPR